MDKVREAEIVRIVKEIGGEGRITLTFVDNDGNERPTFLCKELVKRVVSLPPLPNKEMK